MISFTSIALGIFTKIHTPVLPLFSLHILSLDNNNNNNNMSSAVCQGLESCLEPGLVEPRVLIQNMAPPKSNFSQSIPWSHKPNVSQPQEQNEIVIHNENNWNIIISNKCNNFVDPKDERNNDGDWGWSSIQALTQNRKQVTDAEQVYVHPLVKRSSSSLSTKSLEMCTESLGSETGSSIGESIDDFPSPSLEKRNFEGLQLSRYRESTKKMHQSASFPPPLTSISGSNSIQMKPHRDGGRLVLKAVTVSSCSSYFQAERANGRLRLSLLNDDFADSNNIHDLNEYEENAYNMQHDEEENQNADEEEAEIEDSVEDDFVQDDDAHKNRQWEDELEMNGENVGYDQIGGVGEFPRPSRCKEGGETARNKGMPSWGPFCVAIS